MPLSFPFLPENMQTNDTPVTPLLGRKRTVHEILGSGKVAEIMLWRNKTVSGAYFISVMAIWFLLEVAEYNIVTIFCHFTVTAMLVVFIWSNGARAFNRSPPNIHVMQLEDSMLYKDLCGKLNFFLSTLIKIACGNNTIHFCLIILAIKLLAMMGNYFSTVNLVFIALLCMGTLPYSYEKNEVVIDSFVDMIKQKVSEIYKMLNENIISKIPKWPRKSD